MKKFIINSALFILLALSLATLLDVAVSMGLRHVPKAHLETLNTIMADTLTNDILILGNSRAECSYNPYILDSLLESNSRNLGCSGQAFAIGNLRYKIYTRNNPKPKLVIMNIDHKELYPGNVGFEREQYYPYVLDTLIRPILRWHKCNWADLNVPLYRYRGNYKYIGWGLAELAGLYHMQGRQYKGYINKNTPWDVEELDSLKANNIYVECKIDTMTLMLLDSFLSQTAKDNVKVVMCYAPIYQGVLNQLSDSSYQRVCNTYDSLSRKYRVPILDYRQSYLCKDTLYYYSPNHMNEDAAKAFSIQLAQDIDSLKLYVH